MKDGARLAVHGHEERGATSVALVAFGVFGGLWGVWAVLLPDLSRSLDLSAGPLGLALFGGVLASIPAMVVGGWAADRWGRRTLLVASGGSMGLCFASLSFVGGYASLLVALALWCATSGVYDVVANALAMDLERTTGRRVFAPLHASFSAGGAAGALVAGILVSSGVDYRQIWVGSAVAVVPVILGATFSPFPRATTEPAGDAKEGTGPYRNPSLILLGVVAALAFLSEGTMEDWSGIYLRQTLALPALLGASGVAVYHASMAVGRLGAARAVKHLGNRGTLLVAGSLVAAGMTLALLIREPYLVVAGFLVVGLALSAVTPVAFSIAGDAAPDHAGGASSMVATFGYAGFLVGPVVVGVVAEFSSLRASLAAVALAGFAIATLAKRIET